MDLLRADGRPRNPGPRNRTRLENRDSLRKVTDVQRGRVVERVGVLQKRPVRLVPDSPRNLKVTTAEDLALAELLAGRGE